MGCDTICDFLDTLLTQILLNLETKDSVKTSVLSTRWRNIWLSVPGLDLDTSDFYYGEFFERFMDRFMEFNHGSHLQNFMIWHQAWDYNTDIDRYSLLTLMELIGKVVDRGIQYLDVTLINRYDLRNDFMRHNIYKSKTLVSLKLAEVVLKNPEFFVSLPCLKILHLCTICYYYDGPLVVEKLILGFPVIEDLKLIRPFVIFNEKVLFFLRVRSQTLKRCCLRFAVNRGDTDSSVEIDAPRLEYLSLAESQFDRIVVKNLSSLLMIDTHTQSSFYYGSPLQAKDLRKRDFLTRISSVRHMIICELTLEADFSSSLLQLLPDLLDSCPNLKNLIFEIPVSQEQDKIDFHKVPQCLMLSLEYVKIIKLIMKEKSENKLVNYFLENSAVLKKLTLIKDPYITKQDAKSYKKLSTTCLVIIE